MALALSASASTLAISTVGSAAKSEATFSQIGARVLQSVEFQDGSARSFLVCVAYGNDVRNEGKR